MAAIKHQTVGTSAVTVTLTGGASSFQSLIVVNIDGGATGNLYYTFAANGNTPTTAVVKADDTFVSCTGLPAVPHTVGPTGEIQVSIISSAASTEAAIVAG